jgi:hypothetical protein
MVGPEPAVDASVAQLTGRRAGTVRTLRDLRPATLDGFTEGMRYDGDSGKGCIRHRRRRAMDVDVVRSILEMTAATRGPIC